MSGRGHSPLPRPLLRWGGDTPSPHPTPLGACGASILAPAALDLGAFGASCPPSNEISGSTPGQSCLSRLCIAVRVKALRLIMSGKM